MEFRCINAEGMSGILTKGRVYKGEYARHLRYVKIYRCDDKKPTEYFMEDRFEEVKENEDAEPTTAIYTYSTYCAGEGHTSA